MLVLLIAFAVQLLQPYISLLYNVSCKSRLFDLQQVLRVQLMPIEALKSRSRYLPQMHIRYKGIWIILGGKRASW